MAYPRGRTLAARTPAVVPVSSSDHVARLTLFNLCADASSACLAAAVAAAAQGAKESGMPRSALQCKGLVAHERVGTHKVYAAYSDVARVSLRTVVAGTVLVGLATD